LKVEIESLGSEPELQTGQSFFGEAARALQRSSSSSSKIGGDSSKELSECRFSERLNKYSAPSPAFIEWCLTTGRLFPDEADAYRPTWFHANSKGYEMGHKDQSARTEWFETMKQNLAKFGTWEHISIHECDADYAMKYGDHALGQPFPFTLLKPMLEQQREQMANKYIAELDRVRAIEAAEWKELTTNPKFQSCRNISGSTSKPLQPDDTIVGLYHGCVAAIPELWMLTEQIASAGGSGNYYWSIKKLLRVMKKLAEKYDRHPNAVTDISRTSVVFDTLADLIKALDFTLCNAKVVSIKNRFIEPADGYSDVLLNIEMENQFIVEIQLHLAAICNEKGEAGHGAYKWFRRLLQEDDIYEGERNEKGERHGFGKWTCANGDVYEGQWINDKKEGYGTYTDADGHRYEGSFRDDKREGEWCSFGYFDGSRYEGGYVKDKKEGYGIFTYADGKRYDGYWLNGKRHGQGTFQYADGSKYTGAWRMHRKDGVGRYKSANGIWYDGFWKDDEQVHIPLIQLICMLWATYRSCCTDTPSVVEGIMLEPEFKALS